MSIKTKEKKALIFGASGLTGSELTDLLLLDERYDQVKTFVRKPSGINHPKLLEIVDDLTNITRIENEISGDDLFCCLGTTMKKAGSKKAFEWVDLELPSLIAATASKNGVNKFLIISSIGANPLSANFYLKTKGAMEERISKYPFHHVHILRPSLLVGKRDEFRFGEEAGKIFMRIISFLLFGSLKKYRAVKSLTLAKAMVKLANSFTDMKIVESDKILDIGRY